MNKLRSKLFVTLTFLLSLVIGLSYGIFTITTGKYAATNMLISNLMYGIEIKSTGGSETINGKTVNLSSGNTSTVLITIKSLNPIDTNYQLEYKKTNGEGNIYYASNTGWLPNGDISKDGGLIYTKTIKVVIQAETNITVDFNVSGGYTHDNQIATLEGYNKITEKYDKIYNYTEESNLKDIVNNETNCEEGTCLYGGQSKNNYLQYPTTTNVEENIWRIIGTYNLEEIEGVKLISDIKSTTTKGNIGSSLNEIYNTLEKQEDYIYTTNKFNCTQEGCKESNYNNIGILTTYEYKKIGGINSYLANPNNFYTLNEIEIENITQGGIEETNESTTSGLRPTIYLQSDVNVTGSGTVSDPYRLSSKGDIIMASATLNGSTFPNKPEGYFPTEEDPYIVSDVTCTNGTEGHWDEEKKTIILTTPNLPTTCTVDFTEGYTVTMIGEGATINAPTSKAVGRKGETSFTYTLKENYTLDGNTLSCNKGAIPVLENNTIKITGIKESQTCTLTLKSTPTLANAIKDAYPPQSGRTDFSVIDNGTPGLYTGTDDQGTTYYFSGDGSSMNNWVSFAGKKWRIIRINGNGSVRLLYAGTGGTDGYIGSEQAYNSTSNHPAYVGWKYKLGGSLEADRENANKSTIYSSIETWYNGLSSTDKNYIDSNAIYCNDRSIAIGSYSTSSTFYYAPYTRLSDNKTPTFNCSSTSDRFTTFGLMTADEVAYAGGVWGVASQKAYYYLAQDGTSSITGANWWWTLSSSHFYNDNATMFAVRGSSLPGYLCYTNANLNHVVRPVVSLKSCVTVTSGDGSATNPYQLSISNTCSGHTVTANVTNGYISTSENTKTVSNGGTVEFLIEPNTNYTLKGATVNGGCTLDENTGILTATNVTSTKTCNVILNEAPPSGTLANWIKIKYPPKSGRTNFSSIDNGTPGLYTGSDDQGTTYYFSGDGSSMNNWVSYAGKKWRII
ncbi:MAG: hypothetical protein HFE04_00385, partial [Bacilli bacterium]|nr:hypothetical protein [Bacilli bacterium]